MYKRLIRLVVVSLVLLIGLSLYGPVRASDTEPLPGDFGDSGEYNPEDSSVERTYKIPDIDSVLMWDNVSNRIRPGFGFEIDERKINDWEIKTDAVLVEDGVGVSSMWKVTSIIEVSVGPVGIYDTKEDEYGVGLAVMITKF